MQEATFAAYEPKAYRVWYDVVPVAVQQPDVIDGYWGPAEGTSTVGTLESIGRRDGTEKPNLKDGLYRELFPCRGAGRAIV
jgi:hypothetical protein